jgi:hypothetical protein
MAIVQPPPTEPVSLFTTARFVDTEEFRYGRRLRAVYDLHYELFYKGSRLAIRVPDGFKTDGPSWPIWVDHLLAIIKSIMRLIGLEAYIPSLPDLHMVRSSALHDFLRERLLVPKIVGDYIFLSALKAEGCSLVFRWLAFLAVLCNVSRKRGTTLPIPLN